jgi:hypothetical protein
MMPSEREAMGKYQAMISVFVRLEESITNPDDRKKVTALIQEYGAKIKQIEERYNE